MHIKLDINLELPRWAKRALVYVGVPSTILCGVSAVVYADAVVIPHEFHDGQTLSAEALNDNFGAVKAATEGASTQYDLALSGPSWVTGKAVGVPYRLSSGAWRLRFNLSGALAASTTGTQLHFDGVVFSTEFDQAITCTALNQAPTAPARVYVSSANNHLFVDWGTAASPSIVCSGDVLLAQKPMFVP